MKRKAPCLGSGAPSSLALVALHTVRVGPPPRKRSEEEVAKFIEQTLCVDAVLDPEKGMVTYLPAGNPTFRLLSKDIKQAISTVNKKSHLALVEKGVQTETGFLDLLEMADSLGLKLRNEVVNEDDFSLLNLTNVPSFADVLLSTASTSSSSKGTARSEASKVLTIILREDVGIPLSLKKALQTCTKRGLVDCLTVLAEEFGSLGRFERIIYEEDLCALAARYNQLAVIKWFGGKRPRCGAPRKHLTVLTLKNAIAYRHLSLAKWLRAHKCPLNLSIWEGLVWTGNDALFMKFVDLLKDLPFSDDYLTFLAEENHPRTMYFLMEKQVPFNHHTFAAAAGSENLELMKALHAKGCNVTKFAGFSACDHENLEIFEYLKKVGCPLTSATMEFAAQEGQLNVLKWLKEESVELTRNC